ncbi:MULTISPECIES: hypothetical protein [Acinetobacter]|uniref:Uncharacterized protein n=4 Tax=Acinetobacter baumannii TaxID=470 RepID=A0A0E1JLD3_ACIBA|nr:MULTISPECIES: hypothetical protein [Acinetobacter]EXB47674.1 hypothetical protein J540_2658 [Acinetobacter baumannii 1440422]AJB65557.1 signal peptide protein [Acinetobacter baumannii]ANS20191.1 hypothetical protein G424_02275 [Acinetobacter baumannii PR07]AUT38816.1 hypothetical protein C2U32_12850 [Acinetobacter baumannii]EHU1390054.1 hypothetical protein [Acinetobacter baumannii]
MYKLFSTLLVVVCLNLSACATTLLSEALPNETTKTEKIILAKDQIIALGQAVQNQQEQGVVFIGQDFNYLMTEGSSEFLNIIKNIPVNQRTLIIPSPLLLEMDDPTLFHGELKFQYNIPASKLSDQQKENLKNLGFKNHFMVMENQTQLLYPYAIIRFKGQIYQTSPTLKVQQTIPTPYPIALQQKDEITKKHPFKRVTRMALYPLAMAFDIVTVAPSLILSDLRGDFTK